MKTLLTLTTVAMLATFTSAAGLDKPAEISSIDFKGNVDHVLIKIQAGKLWVEKLLGTPTRMSVSGRTFNPKWQNNTSEPFAKFEGTFKSLQNAVFKLDVKRGRSKVELGELPSAANGWTLTVRITDAPNDQGDYYINISW
jgi:hypothetical protein